MQARVRPARSVVVVLAAAAALVLAMIPVGAANAAPHPGKSAPAAVSWGKGRIDVFARDKANSHLLHKAYAHGSWHGWTDLGGSMKGAPAVTSWGKGRLDVFVTGKSGRVFHKFYKRGWSGFHRVSGVTTDAGPGAVSWGKGRIDVFARDAHTSHLSHNLRHAAYANGSWHRWSNLGGNVKSAPAPASWAKGRIDVIVTGKSGSVFDKTYSHGWRSKFEEILYNDLDFPSDAGPGAVSWARGRIDVFAHDAHTNHLRHTKYTTEYSVGDWDLSASDLGGTFRGAPAAASWRKGRLDVFVTGTSGRVFHTYYRGQTWSRFAAIG